MHEMSLVQGLFEQLKSLAAENNASRIVKVTMEIGPLCGVVVDSFRFGFEILSSQEPMFRGAELVVEVPEVAYTCTACAHVQITAGERPDRCSACGEFFLTPEGGNDLLLKQVEME